MNDIEDPLYGPSAVPLLFLREKNAFQAAALQLFSSLAYLHFRFIVSGEKNLKRTPSILSFTAAPGITTGKLVHYSYRPIKPLSNLAQSGKTCIFQ